MNLGFNLLYRPRFSWYLLLVRKLRFHILNFSHDQNLKPSVPALVRGFAIIDLLAKEPGLTFTDVHTRLQLPKSSAFHLLNALCRLGVVQPQSHPGGGYCLGLRLAELGAAASHQRRIDREAHPYLRAFSRHAQLTCHLGVLEGHEAVYLCKEECEQAIKITNTWVGKRLCLNRSALGKVLLAWLPDSEKDEIIRRIGWEKKTANTLDSPAALKAHLKIVRKQGWALDDEEDVADIRCVAVPVRDRKENVIAAISAVGTILQITKARIRPLAAELVNLAKEIQNSSPYV